MKFKVILSIFLVLALAAGAVAGWIKWSQIEKQREIGQALTIAQAKLEEGNHERAQFHLETVLRDHPDLVQADAIWAKLAQSYEATGAVDRALACWTKIREDFPDSHHVAKALAYSAEAAYDANDYDESRLHWDRILEIHQGSDAVDDARFGLARLTYLKGETVEARDQMLVILEEFPESNRREDIEAILGKVNLEILYSATQQEGDEIYKILSGDSLVTIARKFNISADLIAKVNHIANARNLTVSRRLKIPKTDFSIVVDKTANDVLLMNNGRFFKRYPCRTGKDEWRTPVGKYEIRRKVKNPPWNDPKTGRRYEPGDPENELGTRWLEIDGSIGIHGTIHPDTIGSYASNGCVGLLKEDVEELYDLVPEGTPVEITGKMRKRAQTKL